jgi:aerobic-type carbon monoxide dehydrogenase small subunit (CoxS/CutS family)
VAPARCCSMASKVRACVTEASVTAGRSVTTVDGLESDGKLHSVQEALSGDGATQCGYCTPGMALAAAALLESNPDPRSFGDPARARRQCVPMLRLSADRAGDPARSEGDPGGSAAPK